MDQTTRQSTAARVSAVGFIIVILAGNGWLMYALVGKAVPAPVSYGFAIGILISLLGGLGLAFGIIKRRLAGGDAAPESED